MNRIALPICGLVVLVIGATQGAPPTRADDVFVVAPQERAERAPWVEVSGDGVELHVGRAHGAFALSQVSRGVGGEALGRATASRTRDGAELRRGSVHEWWRARRSDLEHGITLTRRPSGDGPLRLTLALGGGLRAVDGLADAIALRDETGATVARYTHLVVVDADERVLEAHMIADAGAIRIDVDDVDAAYPIVVDPVVAAEEATLDSPGAVAGRQLGWSVAISGDGLRAIVGAPLDDTVVGTDSGSVSIFLRTGTTWSREATILPTSAPARYGYAVAIADDGSRAVVGAPFEGSSGVVHLLVRTGTTWTEETSFGGNISFPSFGTAVAIAGDASSAVVGDSAAHPGASTTGGFRPYTRAGTTWTAGTATFGAASSDAMGVSVALSGNGSYLVVGATGVTTGGMAAGAAYVYLRTGSTYVPQATLTPAAPTSTDSQFGQAVAIATDGSRVVIGYTGDGSFGNLSGSARVFSRAGTIWSAEATLGPSPATSPGAFGNAVALSADGSRALIGYQYDNTRATSAGSGRLFTRTGIAWTEQAQIFASGAAAGDRFGSSLSLSSDGQHALLGAPYDDTTVADAGTARVFTLLLSSGTACTMASQCSAGFCVDGVCCATACGAGAVDCQACSIAAGGTTDGTCTALVAAMASARTCRASAGGCDPVETCSASSLTCPADVRATTGTTCRASTGGCDPVEVCDGVSVACPGDVQLTAGAVCRPAAGACDVVETCDGISPTCPGDLRAPGATICRATLGACDPAEACDGVSTACPADVRSPSGTHCGGTGAGSCVMPATCDGTSAGCGADMPLSAGTLCQPHDTTMPCDADDHCDGAGHCTPTFASATTSCGSPGTDVCDAPDHCSGTSADCVDAFVSGSECRPAHGTCDIAEVCSGTSARCPPDGLLAAGVSCRASTSRCDPAEACDGMSTSCPADVACPGTDSGVRPLDASAVDASGGRGDTGATTPPATGGCACRTMPSAPLPGPTMFAALALAWAARRKRR